MAESGRRWGWGFCLDGEWQSPDHILNVPGRVHPYVRVGRERFTPRALAYHEWKAQWESDLGKVMLAAGLLVPFSGRLAVAFTFLCPTRRADVDNLVKAAQDAAKGVAWADDRTIGAVAGRRVIVPKAEEATVIRVWRLDDHPRRRI